MKCQQVAYEQWTIPWKLPRNMTGQRHYGFYTVSMLQTHQLGEIFPEAYIHIFYWSNQR